MGHLSYEDSKKRVVFGLVLLGVVTLVEVFISLFGKGHIFSGVENIRWLLYPVGLALIVLSLYKAYFIIFEFMHMKYEVGTLARSVLLPTTLLIWAVIAFLQEAGAWKNSREKIEDKTIEPAPAVEEGHGMLNSQLDEDVYIPTLES